MQSSSDEAQQQASASTISQSYFNDMGLQGYANHNDEHMEISFAFSQSTYSDVGFRDLAKAGTPQIQIEQGLAASRYILAANVGFPHSLNQTNLEPSAPWNNCNQQIVQEYTRGYQVPVIATTPANSLVTPLDDTFVTQVDLKASETVPHNVNLIKNANHCPSCGSNLPLPFENNFTSPEPYHNDQVHNNFSLPSSSIADQDDFVASFFEDINTSMPIQHPGLATVPLQFDNQVQVPVAQAQSGFICGQLGCTRIFKRKADRDRHLASVHRFNATMYFCTIVGCSKSYGRGYYRADKLTEHMWRKHGDLGYRKGGQ